ncbi:MAG TPA: phosphoesterase [Polyangiaceae bacterium]|nr:phosphoesterase [Polyangiaceae bacterium]
MTESNDKKPSRAAGPTQAEQRRGAGRRAFLGTAGQLALGGAILGKVDGAHAAPFEEDGFVQKLELRRAHRASRADREFLLRTLRTRVALARSDYDVSIAPHPTNGDEERYENKIGSDTRGLPHDGDGEVDLDAWKSAAKAFASRDPEDFEQIVLGGTRKLVNPVGTLAVNLIGLNPAQFGVPPAPALASAEKAAEAVELYWQALLRDVPFDQYATHPLAQEAIAELNRLPAHRGARINGLVTPETLFRVTASYVDSRDPSGRTPRSALVPGVLDGPYISQLLYRNIPYGTQSIPAVVRYPVPGSDFLTDYTEWLQVQDGQAPTRAVPFAAVPRYLFTGRDLAEYNHGGNPLFWGAALTLASIAPLGPTNPYLSSATQASASATFALGWFQGLLARAISLVIRASYWQKWFVHRNLRPEAYGGLIHHRIANGRDDYPVHPDVLNSRAVARTFEKFGTYLLPQAFPEGAPLHAAYPAGSASIAGAAGTLLKAFFDENAVIPNPVLPDPADPTRLIPYTGAPLTVGGEINKLVSNYAGRTTAGIHYRSDAAAALALGEAVAIGLLRDERATFAEQFDGFLFTRFDGTEVLI